MKLIKVTVACAFEDMWKIDADAVRKLVYRAVADGLEAEVAYTESIKEAVVDVPDIDWDAINPTNDDPASDWQERAREELDKL